MVRSSSSKAKSSSSVVRSSSSVKVSTAFPTWFGGHGVPRVDTRLDAGMETSILGSQYREEEGSVGFSPSENDGDEYIYYTYSCNEEQYKNRLRLKMFLDAVKNFGLLETPEKEK